MMHELAGLLDVLHLDLLDAGADVHAHTGFDPTGLADDGGSSGGGSDGGSGDGSGGGSGGGDTVGPDGNIATGNGGM